MRGRSRGGSRAHGRFLLATALLAAASWSCSGEPPEPDGEAPSGELAIPTAAIDPARSEDGAAHAFSRPVIVLATAADDDLDAARAEMGEESFHVMADDLMWYRAAAEDVLAGLDVPVERTRGRAGLHFMVDGEARHYPFPEIPTLDLVVLYRPGAEPVAVPPIDLSVDPGLVSRYFADSVGVRAPPGA